jgi:hypothetical protein
VLNVIWSLVDKIKLIYTLGRFTCNFFFLIF